MSRKARKFRFDLFYSEHPDLRNKNLEIWIDENNAYEIIELLFEKDSKGKYLRQKRFKNALKVIHNFSYEKDLYDKENISDKTKNITAIKFKRHKGHNWRIYCKEFIHNGKKIVMITAVDKDDQSIDKELKNKLEIIGGYEYDFTEK